MTDRLPSDHPAVESHRVHLERIGRTSRPRVPLPASLDLDPETLVRLSLEGEVTHARAEQSLESRLTFDRAADNRRLARTGEGADRLGAWLDAVDLDIGDPVVLDTLTPGYAYGLRRPGERVIYQPPDAPKESLARIADDLE